MNKNEISQNKNDIINKIFLHRTGIDFEKQEEIRDVNLFSHSIKLPPRELVLVLFDIEKNFDIEISEEELLKEKFNTYNNICNIVK
ncbi:MAG: peptide maturation system acyl carrier-related protein [Eubacteriales bacterium]